MVDELIPGAEITSDPVWQLVSGMLGVNVIVFGANVTDRRSFEIVSRS